MGKITRCLDSTRYQEYLFNTTPLFILLLLLDPHNPHADLSIHMDPFWTLTRRLVFALHSFSLVFSSHCCFFWWLSVSNEMYYRRGVTTHESIP